MISAVENHVSVDHPLFFVPSQVTDISSHQENNSDDKDYIRADAEAIQTLNCSVRANIPAVDLIKST